MGDNYRGGGGSVVNGVYKPDTVLSNRDAVAVDPDGPVVIAGMQFSQAQLADALRAGVLTKEQVDSALLAKMRAGAVQSFGDAPDAGAATNDASTDDSAEGESTEAEQVAVEEAHNVAVEEFYTSNSDEAIDATFEAYANEGVIPDGVNLPPAMMATMEAGFRQSVDMHVHEFGLDSHLLAALVAPRDEQDLRRAVIYQDVSTLKKLGAIASHALESADVLSQFVPLVKEGGFKVEDRNGVYVVDIPDVGMMPLSVAIRQRHLTFSAA